MKTIFSGLMFLLLAVGAFAQSYVINTGNGGGCLNTETCTLLSVDSHGMLDGNYLISTTPSHIQVTDAHTGVLVVDEDIEIRTYSVTDRTLVSGGQLNTYNEKDYDLSGGGNGTWGTKVAFAVIKHTYNGRPTRGATYQNKSGHFILP